MIDFTTQLTLKAYSSIASSSIKAIQIINM